MTIRLFAGFKTSDLGGSINGTINTNNFTFPPGSYLIPFDAQLWASGSLVSYSGACATLGEVLSDASEKTITCYYDNQLNKVVLTASANISVLTFSKTAQRVFGLSSSYSNWDFITGSSNPYFVWTATQGSRAKDSEIFEEDSFVEERLSDSGKSYSVGRLTVAQLRNWEFINEAKENVFDKWSNEQSPYTWEKFVKNIRKSGDVFILLENVSKKLISFEDREGVYALKEESTAFAPKELFPDFVDYWNIPVRTRAYFIKHKDQKLYPPGSVCLLPGIVTPISPQQDEFLFLAPNQLVWSSDFDYSGSNPNKYIVYVKKNNPSFTFPQYYYPFSQTSQSLFSSQKTGGNWYWRVDSYNQCGSRVGNTFGYKTAGGTVIQSKVLTDLNPYLFASGSGQAFDGFYTNHTFDYYSLNESRDIADKISQDGNWFIVESEIIQAYPNNNIKEWLDENPPTGIVYSEIANSPLNTAAGYTTKAVEMIVSGSGVEFNDPWSEDLIPLPYYKDTFPFTFSILCKNIPGSKTITGIRVYSTDDDYNIYYSIPLTGGIGALGNNNLSTPGSFFVSGSQEFQDSNNETWTYHWFKITNSDTYDGNATKIVPCATTGSITDAWTMPAPTGVDATCSIGYPQIAYLNEDIVTKTNENLVNINTLIVSTASIGVDTYQLTKSVDIVSASYLSDFVESGSAMKIRLVPSYSSSYSPVDRPIIQFSGSTSGLKFKQSSSFSSFNDLSNLRAEMTSNSGSYSGSWELGFKPGEKIDIIVDHDYNRVDWYQSNGYQNHFYFSGGWQTQIGNTFYIGSSGSSVIAFDGLINISLTSSSPNAPMPPTGSNVEDELIADSIMWFDAAKGVTLSGSFLHIWNDQSPRQMIAYRSAGAVTNNSMQYFLTGGIGGEPGVYADGNGEYGVSGSMFESTGSWFTLYVVYNDLDTSTTSVRYHFDVYNTVSSRRRIVVQKNGRRAGNWTGAFNVSGPGVGFPAASRYANTGSMCFTYVMQGNEVSNILNFVGRTTHMYRNRGLFGRTLTSNMISHPSCWVNDGNNPNNFSLFGSWNEASGQRALGTYSLICAFSGSHNETQRQKVWDYIEGRFGVAETKPRNYVFTSGTMPYQYTDTSLIPSASVNPDFYTKAFQFEFTLQDWTLQNNIFFANESSNERFVILNNGSIRFYASGSSFFTMGSVSGSDIGDRMRVLIDWERGNNLIENLTQNKVVGQQYWTSPITMSYSNIEWLYYSSTNPGLGSGSWDVSAPWIFEDY